MPGSIQAIRSSTVPIVRSVDQNLFLFISLSLPPVSLTSKTLNRCMGQNQNQKFIELGGTVYYRRKKIINPFHKASGI
jgi:hypothetical protein